MSLGTDTSAGGSTGRTGRNYTGTAGRRGAGRPRGPFDWPGGGPGPGGGLGPGPAKPPPVNNAGKEPPTPNPVTTVPPPGVTTGPGNIPVVGNPGGGTGTPSDILSFYSAPMPPIVQAYMQNMQKGGFTNLPSFQDLYGTYRATAEKETARNAAALTETMGSSGSRYGSDILNAQSRLQENLGVDLSQASQQFLMGLRQQQFGEVSGMGQLQYGANEAGMSRMWEDFLRRTSPPPGLSSLYNLSQGYGLPATVIG
jgi:hypothetical protein